MKKTLLSLIIVALVFGIINISHRDDSIYAQEVQGDGPLQNEFFTTIDKDGNVTIHEYEEENDEMTTLSSNDYQVVKIKGDEEIVIDTVDTYEEAKEIVASQPAPMDIFNTTTYDIQAVAATSSITYGVAKINGYVTYKEYDGSKLTARSSYVHGSSANDAAYITTLDNGKTIRVKQAGVMMDIPASSVQVTNYTSSSKVNYYMGDKNGKLYHYYYYNSGSLASTQVGYTPSYLKSNTKYYSYDGHYFYTTYQKMIDDYRSNPQKYPNAVNASNPYYNYYQYLSLRSKTKFTASDLNKLVTSQKGSNTNSKLKNQGTAYLNVEKTYGINASLMFGVSINESAWGLSSYAINRNNLFGIGAVDSNPNNAKSFASVQACLEYFGYNTISAGYLSPFDWRYFGPHIGDKQSGINVKYASDPYWGEKAASFSYLLSDASSGKDYQSYQLGIVNNGYADFYKESDFKNLLYGSGANATNEYIYSYPVTIQSESSTAYKVFSDTPLTSSRSSISTSAKYSESRDYVYAKKASITKVGNVTTSGSQTGTSKPETSQPETSKPSTTYNPGDVNGDGKVSSLDYIQIKNHIMKTKVLTGDALKRADVNGDGKVSSLDYIKIKNHIMGTSKLF